MSSFQTLHILWIQRLWEGKQPKGNVSTIKSAGEARGLEELLTSALAEYVDRIDFAFLSLYNGVIPGINDVLRAFCSSPQKRGANVFLLGRSLAYLCYLLRKRSLVLGRWQAGQIYQRFSEAHGSF